MRLVTVDNGNTNPNVAIHDINGVMQVYSLEKHQAQKDDVVIIASVGQPIDLIPTFDIKKYRTEKMFFDMPVNYALSLGQDRLVTAYSAFKSIRKNESILIIDAGTFITCDLITLQGFQGGYIFPGINRFLHSYGQSAQLPMFSKEQWKKSIDVNTTIPHTTESAISVATKIYLESMLKEMVSLHSPDKIILTGGSAEELSRLVSSKVPFELTPHLVHSSLRLIYDLHLQEAI